MYSSPALLACLRAETGPFVLRERERGAGRKIEIRASEIKRSCPMIRATMSETLRMYHTPWTIRYAKEDIQLNVTPRRKVAAGSYVVVPHHGPSFDPEGFPNPLQFNPGRFVGQNIGRMHAGSLRPWGIGAFQCKGRALAEVQFLSFVAGFINIWDVVNLQPWDDMGAKPTVGVAAQTGMVTVALRRATE